MSWLKKIGLVFLSLSSFAVGALPTPNLDSTALSVLIAAEPRADLTDAKVQARLKSLTAEVTALFAEVLTADGQTQFFQPLPFEPGKLLLGLDPAVVTQLLLLPSVNKKINLAQTRTGIASLDALNAKYAATELEVMSFGALLTLDPKVNPNLVAEEYRAVPGVRYAQANHVITHGNTVERLGANPPVYRLTVGWGDCLAGCISKHRRYYEVAGSPATVKAVGVAGDPLEGEAAAAASYFLK